MVIQDFHIPDMATFEPKADPPLFVDTDAPLTGAVAGEGFQPVPRGYSQIIEPLGAVEHSHLTQSDCGYVGKTRNAATLEQGFGVVALEGRNHQSMLALRVSNVKHLDAVRYERHHSRMENTPQPHNRRFRKRKDRD